MRTFLIPFILLLSTTVFPQNYHEWGYSIGIPMLGSVGVFTSFDSFKHSDWGVSFSLEFLQLFGLN